MIGAASSATVAIGLMLVGPYFARTVLDSTLVAAVMPLTAGWLAAYSIQSLVVESFRGLQDFRSANMYDTILTDVALATAFGVMWVFGPRQATLNTIILIICAITAIIATIAGMRLRKQIRIIHGSGQLLSGEIFAIAWPSLITNIASYLLSSGTDLLILGAFRQQSQVAVYGAATRLVILVATPLWILRGVLPPMISELYAQGHKRELERTLRAGATMAGLPSFAILVVFLLFGGPVMGLAYGANYESGATVLAVLAVGRMVAVWAGASGVTLLMTGHQKAMMTITVCTGIASLCGGILVAPRFGSLGIATVTATVAVVQNLLQIAVVRRRVGVWSQMQFSPRMLHRFLLGRRTQRDVDASNG